MLKLPGFRLGSFHTLIIWVGVELINRRQLQVLGHFIKTALGGYPLLSTQTIERCKGERDLFLSLKFFLLPYFYMEGLRFPELN